MRKLILLCLALTLSLFSQTVTVIGNIRNAKLNRYPVDVRQFQVGKGDKLNGAQELRLCEALDNSQLIIFGVGMTGWDSLFSTPSICNSFMDALRRGATFYVGPQDYDSLGAVGVKTHQFFKSVGSYPWTRANYRSLPRGSNGKAKAVSGLTWLKGGTMIDAAIQFGSLEERPWKPLFQDEKGYVMGAMQEQILGKGTIIFCAGLDVFRQADHPVLEALIQKSFGNLKKVGLGKQKAKHDVTLPEKFLFLKGTPQSIILSSPKSKETTSVEVWQQGTVLNFVYHCRYTIPKEPPAKIPNRDGDIWNDCCVELFLSSTGKKEGDFYQFIINNAGAIYDAKNGNRSWNAPSAKATVIQATTEWTVRFSVDAADMQLDKSAFFYANLSHINNATHSYLLWNENAGNLDDFKGLGIITRVSVQEVEKTLAASMRKTGLVFAQLPFPTRLFIDSTAPAGATTQLSNIRLLAPMNSREPAEIGLYNGDENTAVIRFEAADFLKGPGNPRAWDIFTVKEGVPILDMVGNVHLDALAKLNESMTVTIPAGEARLLWLEADTGKLQPGTYTWNVEFVSTMQPKLPVKTQVVLEVVNWSMPDNFSFFFSASGPYDYSYSRGKIEAYWKLCKKYHFTEVQVARIPQNTFVKRADGSVDVSERESDYVTVEKKLTEMGFSRWKYTFGIVSYFNMMMKKLGGKSFQTPEGKALFTKWISTYGRALKNAGIDMKKASCPMIDEPRSTEVNDVIEAAKITRAAGFQIYSDFATWSTVEDVRKIAPYCDCLSPWEPRLLTRPTSQEELSLLRKSKKQWITYLCSPTGNQQSLLEYFRLRGMRNYLLHSDGFEVWAMNSWRDNDWEAMRPTRNKDGMWMVQHGNDGPIPTIRLEAFFEGARDLTMLRCAADSASPAVQKLCSEKKIKQLVSEQDPQKILQWREQLLRALSAEQHPKE